MNNNFDQSLGWLLQHEGGFVNHPDDPGGLTNKGITARVYQQWLADTVDADAIVDEQTMRNIPDGHVEQIYREEYWNRLSCDKLASGIDWFCFDFGVNAGVGRAARTLQRTVGAKVDGGIGPQTLAAVKEMDPIEVVEEMHRRRQAFYERLKTFETFGKGWTRRNQETLHQALALITG